MNSNVPSSKIDRDLAQAIVGYHSDKQGHWVAQLACGHNQQVGPSRNPFLIKNANAQEEANVLNKTEAAIPKDLPTVAEARRQAKILHTALHSTLQIVHHRYYHEDQSMPLPAATLKDVFAELEEEEGIKLRWLAVDGKAMNVTHEPQNTFEIQAVKALKSGKDEFELIDDGDGFYRYTQWKTFGQGLEGERWTCSTLLTRLQR